MSGIIVSEEKIHADRTLEVSEVSERESAMGGSRHAARTSAKGRIIEAYLRLLAKNPHKKATVSAVAKAAGCNRDTFYYYFTSIDDAAKSALNDLAPKSVPHIARTLIEGDAVTIPARARMRMLLIAKIAKAHPRIRLHLEGMLKDLWLSEFGIDAETMEQADEAVLDFMAAGTVGLICEHLTDSRSASEFDAAFSAIARTFGKTALDYASERRLISAD